jgi:Flp pilus assembly protein TadG
MNNIKNQKGQAIILLAFAVVGLVGFGALAIDGGRVLSDRRHAQNAADTAALAGALAYAHSNDIENAAQSRALGNGYDNDSTAQDVTVSVANAPAGLCPANTKGKDITVTIVSTIDTTFARVIGRNNVTNTVTATTRVCDPYFGPPFNGNAIVALAPSGKGYDGTGTPDWDISGGGIFSNSSSSNAAYCNGAASITAPSVTVVGGVDFNCHGVNIPSTTPDAPSYTGQSISSFFPRQPACNGIASFSGGQWHPQAGKDGSQVSFGGGDMDFAPGLYCVKNSPGPYHGAITGTEVTFYIMSANFSMKFAGGGSLTATAPTSGEYQGILMYLAPQFDINGNLIQTQQIDMRGNGIGDVVGTIFAPSADVTMFGNSGTAALFNSQIIAYHVDSGGTANIKIEYNPKDNLNLNMPVVLTFLKYSLPSTKKRRCSVAFLLPSHGVYSRNSRFQTTKTTPKSKRLTPSRIERSESITLESIDNSLTQP